jgi:hypothetical protein
MYVGEVNLCKDEDAVLCANCGGLLSCPMVHEADRSVL